MTNRTMTAILCALLTVGSAAACLAQNRIPPVPEPGAYAMLACGAVTVGGFLVARTRRNRK